MSIKIEISDEAFEAYERVAGKHSKYAIFKADEQKEKVLLETVGDLEATFDNFKDAFPDDQPR